MPCCPAYFCNFYIYILWLCVLWQINNNNKIIIKWNTDFSLVPKSVTLRDFERRNGSCYFTKFLRFGAHDTVVKVRLILSRKIYHTQSTFGNLMIYGDILKLLRKTALQTGALRTRQRKSNCATVRGHRSNSWALVVSSLHKASF